MRHLVQATCDGAALCAFDPAALPPDFDRRVVDDPVGLMESLQAEGRFWLHETGGDGTFLFAVQVDEPQTDTEPGAIAIFDVPAFSCPSGTLWLCGAEFAANDPSRGSSFTPKGGLAAFSGSGGRIDIPPGRYRLRIMRVRLTLNDTGSGAATMLGFGRGLFLILGGLAIAFAAVIIPLGLAVKAYQYLSGSPLAAQGWRLFALAAAALVAGLASVGTGLLFSRWRRPTAGDGPRPDFLVEIATGHD